MEETTETTMHTIRRLMTASTLFTWPAVLALTLSTASAEGQSPRHTENLSAREYTTLLRGRCRRDLTAFLRAPDVGTRTALDRCLTAYALAHSEDRALNPVRTRIPKVRGRAE